MSLNPYALVISTRGPDRVGLLAGWLPRLAWQTQPPDLILLINNNDDLGDEALRLRLGKFPLPLDIQPCAFPVKSDVCGSQTALLKLVKDFRVIVKWDDDLIPQAQDCLERLVKLVYAGFAAAGGLYPKFIQQRASKLDGWLAVPDGLDKHVQFFEWSGSHTILRRKHLYSSFAYDTEVAVKVGGFCTDYSQLCYRHETDFTLRLNQYRPGLAVDTAALAIHLVSAGGVRLFTSVEYRRMAEADAALFSRRMANLGISEDY